MVVFVRPHTSPVFARFVGYRHGADGAFPHRMAYVGGWLPITDILLDS
jgi:hypothetical protein